MKPDWFTDEFRGREIALGNLGRFNDLEAASLVPRDEFLQRNLPTLRCSSRDQIGLDANTVLIGCADDVVERSGGAPRLRYFARLHAELHLDALTIFGRSHRRVSLGCELLGSLVTGTRCWLLRGSA